MYLFVDVSSFDRHDTEMKSAVVSGEVLQDHDGLDWTVQYKLERKMLPVLSLFVYCAQYPEQFRFGRRVDGHAFKIRLADNICLTCDGGCLIR